MSDKNINDQSIGIQLELPDYSYEYEKYLNEQKQIKKEDNTVIIIDLY